MNNHEIVEKLRKVRRLVNKGRCTNALARNKSRHAVEVFSRSAYTFCITGAIWRVSGKHIDELSTVFSGEIAAALEETLIYGDYKYGGGLIKFNDDFAKSKKDVIKLIDETIERLSE